MMAIDRRLRSAGNDDATADCSAHRRQHLPVDVADLNMPEPMG
jgi:hypothetical protein